MGCQQSMVWTAISALSWQLPRCTASQHLAAYRQPHLLSLGLQVPQQLRVLLQLHLLLLARRIVAGDIQIRRVQACMQGSARQHTPSTTPSAAAHPQHQPHLP
jgi:hypothetical protein